MEMTPCLALVKNISNADRDALIERVDSYIAAGLSPQDAQREAVNDVLGDIENDRSELEQLAREQYPDLFAPKPEPKVDSIFAHSETQFELPTFGKLDATTEAIQDRYNRWRQAIAAVRAQGGVVNEVNDFYAAEERFWGAVGSRLEDFQGQVEAWIQRVTDAGLHPEHVAMYAYAQHAKERNAFIASKRPGMQDGGSGMSNDTAQAIIDDAREAGFSDQLQLFAAEMRGWIAGTREVLLDGGLIDESTFLAWSAMFDNYVPLRGLAGKEGPARVGKGFNISGKEGKEARGRYSEAKNVLEQIIQDRTRALIRVGKNEVLRSFAQFVMDNPSPNLWEINAVERKPMVSVDENGDRVLVEEPKLINDDRTVHLKDGGREIAILVKDQVLRDQLQNAGADEGKLGKFFGAMALGNRYLSHIYTTLSPTFVVLNGARDLQTGSMAVIDELGFMAIPKLMANLPRAFVDASNAERGVYSPNYQLYRATGGKTAYFGLKTVDDLAKEVSDLVGQAEQGVGDPRRIGRAALGLIEHMNGTIENTTRYALFLTARESGLSLTKAASFAKNGTTNFNRKGNITPQLGAWFLFANPAIQDTRTIARRLTNPKIMATLGMGMTGLFALALRNAAMGDDDDGVAWWDKIPGEIKQRNVVIILPPGVQSGEPIPGTKVGRYLKIPMAYGYSWFATIANEAADVMRHMQDKKRGRSWQEAIPRVAASATGSFVPVQEAGQMITQGDTKQLGVALLPSIAKPVVQAATNVNAFGRTMYPETEHDKATPDSQKYFVGQAGTIFQKGAEALNVATGGSKYKSGAIDMTPATLETLLRSYGGGPAQFTLDMLNAVYARQHIRREDIEARRLPFVKQLYGQIDAETDRVMGYERLQRAREQADPIKRALREGARDEALKMAEESDGAAYLGNAITVVQDRMSLLRKQELSVINSDLGDASKYSQLSEIALRKRQVLQEFNRAYDEAIELQAKRKATAPAP